MKSGQIGNVYDYRDPIHGFIVTSELEQQIIESAPFQRLRRICQLGPTHFVYPTASHTRFEHSLGVLQASSNLLDSLYMKQGSRDVLNWQQTDFDEAKILLRLAALLHDVGHAPFSHATEELFPSGYKHEDYTYKIIVETEIGDSIDLSLGVCPRNNILNDIRH